MANQLNIKVKLLEEKEFLDIKELIEILGISQNTIYRICKRKELKKYKFGGKCWFRSIELKSYLTDKGILN